LIIFGGNAYFAKEDIDAFESLRDVDATWSKRMKETHYPHYGAETCQRMWGECLDAWAGIYEAKEGDVCMAQAKSITCPTLVLHGAKDPICLSDHPEWFAANIPGDGNTALHVLPEGKHNLHLRYADEVNQLVRDFAAK
jgi:valacyclovir hydrolase